jgi:hypothetical protein
MPHVIRLREPWECEALGTDGEGPLRYSRRFHKPTGLTAGSRVWLVVEEVDGDAEASVNSRGLGDIKVGTRPSRFDITASMEANNLLEITVGPVAGQTGRLGAVRLEIEEAASSIVATEQKNLTQRHRGTEDAGS